VPVVLLSAAPFDRTDPTRLGLNLTGLFGFVNPAVTSHVDGGWSIGIEVVFYFLFPLLTSLSTRMLVALTVAAYAVRVIWVTAVTPAGATIHEVWVPYTQMPSFMVFFLLGLVLARVGDTGSWTGPRARLATILGDLSYGTYLLHPIVWIVTGNALVTILGTPLLALGFHRYEMPVQRWLRKRLSGSPRGSSEATEPAPALAPRAVRTVAPAARAYWARLVRAGS
jgi:peptidoglycan/LPS O-acetylase OafA/YrhL